MKPLTIVTTYNRLDVTKRMLASLEPSLDALQTVIVDNSSDDEMVEWLRKWWVTKEDVALIALKDNIGCPRALNLALEQRKSGQAVIKLDNDILMPALSKWLTGIQKLVERNRNIAMVSAYWKNWNMSRVISTRRYENMILHYIFPVIGHAVYHTGEFKDRVDYFDVLNAEHLYGFEDNIMSHKAELLGLRGATWGGWRIKNIQRHSALGNREKVSQHVENMRRFYNRRVSALRAGGTIYTNAEGIPANRGAT